MRWIAYRAIMKFAHKYGWHYAPERPMPMPDNSAPGTYMCWCTWCGLRGSVYRPTIEQARANMAAKAQPTPANRGE